MAQKTTVKAPAAAQTAASAVPAAAAPAVAVKPKTVDTFVFVKAVAEGEKLAPQARVIVAAVQAAGTTGITREALNTALTGKLVTRQPIGRIVTYYQKLLIERGYLVINETEVAS